MHLHTTPRLIAPFISTLLLLILYQTPSVNAHNITHILNNFPDFSTFNHYLTITHLALEINTRETITVCAVNNAIMSHLLQKHPSITTIKNLLSLHILLDYFSAKKLHQITSGTTLSATLFQATGSATETSGLVNITDLKGGKVFFGVDSSNAPYSYSIYVKSLKEIPYNISVIQISNVLSYIKAQAPTPEPADVNITSLMSMHGCRSFAEALVGIADALKNYNDNIEGGLTVFCPVDNAFKQFLPKFKNLTVGEKQSLLEYHGIPVYQSKSMLKSSNGVMNTLATDGASKYDFIVQNDGEGVTIKTSVVTAKIVETLIDQEPLVIFTIDKVLLPKEIFNISMAPAPAPEADPPVAESPKGSKKRSMKKAKHEAPPAPASIEAPADSPDDYSADQEADSDGAVENKGFRFVVLVLSFWFVNLVL